MKKHITEILSIFMIAVLLVFSSLSFVSAASTLIDESKTVSITLNCDKQGYEFTVYKVGTLDSTAESPYETKYNSLVPQISSSVLSGDTEGILKVLDNLDELPSTAPAVAAFTVSSASTTKTVSGLAQGIYYIKATNYPAGVKAVTNSVVALPYYDSGWVYSIPAIDLATKVSEDTPTTQKEITNSTKNNVNYTDVSLGDTVDFKLINSTAGSASIKLVTYTVKDNMSAGLTLNNNSFVVYLADKDGMKISNLNSSEDYNVNITNQKDGENTTFDISLTEDYLSKDDFYENNVAYVVVTYSATLNKYAVKGIEGNPNEDIELEYGNDSTIDSVPGNTVYVYTYGVGITKLNEEGTALEGATFKLYKNESDAENKVSEIATGTSDSAGNVKFMNSDNEEITLASGDYFIRETEAPVGYNIYGKVIPITIDVTYNTVFTNNTWIQNAPENGIASCSVTDTRITLPQTGGHVEHLYIGGICFILCGLSLLLIARKKKR